ncbi:MAG: hypothetical protein QOC92_2617 [Acidimicrobiaceae bacterium]|jgi:hypothetical protein
MADITLEPINTQAGAHASLAERLTALRRRTGFVVTDRTLLTVGSILMPLGLVLVLLGWYGASHTARVFEQIPYMVSGGLLGIVLVIAGGFCYFGFFLARLLATSREMLDSLLRLEERFESVGLSAESPVERGARLPLVVLVATRNGAMFHRPDCPTVAGKAPAELRSVRATDGLTPCRICAPVES